MRRKLAFPLDDSLSAKLNQVCTLAYLISIWEMELLCMIV
jgi:hypothetical protein